MRIRERRIEDGLPVPLKLQLLEPDHLDAGKTGDLPNGGFVVQGVEFDALGRRRAPIGSIPCIQARWRCFGGRR